MLGFLQMTCAAIASTAATLLPLPAAMALAILLFASTALAVLVFRLRLAED